MKIGMKKMSRVFVMGDLHGDARLFDYRVSMIDNPTENDYIICAGDVGIEYGGRTYGNIKKAMKRFPGKVIVMRGNHDDRYIENHTNEVGLPLNNSWDFFMEDDCVLPDKYGNNYFFHQKKFPNIWYTSDSGGIYNIDGYNILFIPGAYSVDKYYRLQHGYPYNSTEQLNKEEQKCLTDIIYNWCSIGFDIDFVISHTAPYKLQPYFKDLFLDFLDQSTVDNSMEIWLDSIADYCENIPSFKHWFFGHFHDDRVIQNKYTMLYHDIVELADYEKEN